VRLFESPEEFETMLAGFFRLVSSRPDIAKPLLGSKLVIRFSYSDPDVVIVVDCSGDSIDVRPGDTAAKATVDMSMKAEIAHKFWFGKVNLMQALTRRQMVAKGPVPKILQLLPAIRPTYALYPEYLRDNGYERYIVY
jgi:SCP-2 sterol transfer family